MNEHPDIEINNLSFSYDTVPVLEDVNLTVEHGEFATIVGPNGGGKTTLLKLLLGILKPVQGKIAVLGNAPGKARLKLGYMPQHADLDPQFPVTVMDVVLLGRLGSRFGGRYSKKDKQLAWKALEEVQLEGMARMPFSKLSGGQRQRALIARALCCNPEMLLLDEPTANIDPEVEENLLTILQELNQRMTILLVSHDLGFVSRVVKSVICVNRRVLIHPTSRVDGTLIKDIYGDDYCMVRHDHRCSEKGHFHD
jgi:zinc transport system ATP-binding protein